MLVMVAVSTPTTMAHAWTSWDDNTAVVGFPSDRIFRWNAAESATASLHDGIQVAVQSDFASALGATPEEVPLVEDAVRAAFSAWESPVLQFDVSFEGAVEGVGPSDGAEVDVFAVPGSHPAFGGQLYFGVTFPGAAFLARYDRQLTNGIWAGGLSFTKVDIFINIDTVQAFRPAFPDPAAQLAAIQRLIMHELGHGLGLHHPNELYLPNFDTDLDPLNEMTFDVCDPTVIQSPNIDFAAIMMRNPPTLDALLETVLHPDDRGGRDYLYPVPGPGAVCEDRPAPNTTVSFSALQRATEMDTDSDGTVVAWSPPTKLLRIGPDETTPTSMLIDGLMPGATGDLVTGAGIAYVSRTDADRVLRINADGSSSEIVTSLGGGPDAPLDGPVGLALAASGDLYVAGSLSHNVLWVTPGGTITEVLDQQQAAQAGIAFQEPVALALGDDGSLFVAARESDNVLRLWPNGVLEELIGPAGADGAALDGPNAIAFESTTGTLFVSGELSHNVFRVAPYDLVEVLADSTVLTGPRALGIDPITGDLYVASMESANVLRIRRNKQIDHVLGAGDLDLNDVRTTSSSENGYDDLVVDDSGRVYVSRAANFQVLRVNPECGDSLDNDGDGHIDYPDDPQCISKLTSVEDGTPLAAPAIPVCSLQVSGSNASPWWLIAVAAVLTVRRRRVRHSSHFLSQCGTVSLRSIPFLGLAILLQAPPCSTWSPTVHVYGDSRSSYSAKLPEHWDVIHAGVNNATCVAGAARSAADLPSIAAGEIIIAQWGIVDARYGDPNASAACDAALSPVLAQAQATGIATWFVRTAPIYDPPDASALVEASLVPLLDAVEASVEPLGVQIVDVHEQVLASEDPVSFYCGFEWLNGEAIHFNPSGNEWLAEQVRLAVLGLD